MKYSWAAIVGATLVGACASPHASSEPKPMMSSATSASSPAASDASGANGASAVNAEFEWRRTHEGGGRFLSGASLHASPDASLTSVLHMQIPGFATQRGGHTLVSASESCSVDTYVNGLWSPGASDDLRARDVDAVEYYEATTAPPRYRRTIRACPVLLIWLRR